MGQGKLQKKHMYQVHQHEQTQQKRQCAWVGLSWIQKECYGYGMSSSRPVCFKRVNPRVDPRGNLEHPRGLVFTMIVIIASPPHHFHPFIDQVWSIIYTYNVRIPAYTSHYSPFLNSLLKHFEPRATIDTPVVLSWTLLSKDISQGYLLLTSGILQITMTKYPWRRSLNSNHLVVS